MEAILQGFNTFFDFLNIHGVKYNIHFSISKPFGPFNEENYYHKTIRIWCQLSSCYRWQKEIIDLFVSIPSNVNNSRIFKKFNLYFQVHYHGLFFLKRSQECVTRYQLGNKGCPLVLLLMTLNKNGKCNIIKFSYNKKHTKG